MQCSEEHLGSARALACWRWRPRHRGLLFPPGNLFPPAAPGKVRFGLTWLCMRLLVGTFQAPYLPAQVATTGLVMVWSYAANKFWTFGGNRP